MKVTLPSGTLRSNQKFRVAPLISSFSPTSGAAGTVVTITGISLGQTSRVTIGWLGTRFTVVDDVTVTATVPAGAMTGRRITITTPRGTIASASTFTVTE